MVGQLTKKVIYAYCVVLYKCIACDKPNTTMMHALIFALILEGTREQKCVNTTPSTA